MKTNRLLQIFNHELSIANIRFKEIFKREPFGRYLFEEFCKAEIKPCLWLYRESFYSQQEYEELVSMRYGPGMRNFLATLDKIEKDFEQMVQNGSLSDKFYCPDLQKIPTVAALIELDGIYMRWKKFKYQENGATAEHYAKKIISVVESIEYSELKQEVYSLLIDDDINIYALNKEGVKPGSYCEWEAGKLDYFNEKLLSQLLQRGDKHNNRGPGRPGYIVDEKLSLKNIILDGYYPEARKYYKEKQKEKKFKKKYQYYQLICQFQKKRWIRYEFSDITKKQMQRIIFNEFGIHIKLENFKDRGQENIFEDLKEMKSYTLPV